LRILIVDDEPLARDRLRRLLEHLRPEARISEARNGDEALAQVRSEQPELVLLDVRMPGRDGIDVAAALASQAEAPAVVFCTAYDEYALQALNQQAMAYLLKPVREEDLERALASAVRVNRAQLAALRDDAPGRAEITSSGHSSVQTLPVADIRCFVAEDKYLRAVAPQGEMLISEALKDLEQEFGGRFLRVHRNALVARAHLTRLRRSGAAWVAELDGVSEAPVVSRRHLARLRAVLADSGTL
jgi:two-component system response regulator AlgR